MKIDTVPANLQRIIESSCSHEAKKRHDALLSILADLPKIYRNNSSTHLKDILLGKRDYLFAPSPLVYHKLGQNSLLPY